MEAATKDALYGDSGLVLKSKAKHAAVSAKLRRPFDFAKSEKPFIVQYEINFQSGQVRDLVMQLLKSMQLNTMHNRCTFL